MGMRRSKTGKTEEQGDNQRRGVLCQHEGGVKAGDSACEAGEAGEEELGGGERGGRRWRGGGLGHGGRHGDEVSARQGKGSGDDGLRWQSDKDNAK